MIRKAHFASMSVEELWEIYEEISKLLEAKMLVQQKKLERRLEPPRVCRRLFGLSYAAMAACSSMA